MPAAKPENRIVPSGSDALPSPAAVSAMTSSLTPFSASRAATQRSLSASTTPTGLDSAP